MDALAEAKPGDTVYICSNFNRNGWLAKVERRTPSGRIILSDGNTFNPDGYRRGQTGWDRQRARIATADDIAGVNRYNLVRKIESFRAWDKLTPDDLKAVAEIVDRQKKE